MHFINDIYGAFSLFNFLLPPVVSFLRYVSFVEKMEEMEKTLKLAETQQKLLTTALDESNKKAKMYEETNAFLEKGLMVGQLSLVMYIL